MSDTLIFILIMFGIIAVSVMVIGSLLIARMPRVQFHEQPDPLLAKTLVVHTQDDQTVRGVLLANHADRITLTEAIYVSGQGESGMNGLIHIPWSNVRFMQEIRNTIVDDRKTLKAVDS